MSETPEYLEIDEGDEIPEGYELVQEPTPPETTPPEPKEDPKEEPKEEPSLRDSLGIEDDEGTSDTDLKPEDLEDEKQEEKLVEEKSLLEELSEDSLETSTLPKNFDELNPEEQDKELAMALEDDTTWAKWRESSEQVHGDIDREFAVDALKAGLTPQYLSQRGIYSLKDFNHRLEQEEAKTSDSAIVLGNPDDAEERAVFYEEHFGIPRDIDGYDKAALKGTIFDGDEDATQALLQKAARNSLSQAQFLAEAHERDAIARESKKRQNSARNSYRSQQKEALAEIYGEASREVARDALQAIQSTSSGVAFLKEFAKSKVVDSASLYGLVHELLNFNVSKRDITLLGNSERYNDVEDSRNLNAYKTQDLVAEMERIGKLKIAQPSMASHSDPAIRAKHVKALRAIGKLGRILEQRKKNLQ